MAIASDSTPQCGVLAAARRIVRVADHFATQSIGHLTDVQELFRLCRVWDGPGSGGSRTLDAMRLRDNWWERLSILARFAPVLVMLAGVVFSSPMGYYWE